MYFKRLELNGFKSFADPVVIELTQGITCIVGPNGSGKSNISDAIRWVLGEQSPKMLRGSKMDEVIFAGTQGRKPKGMAEVTLVIDNTDHELPIDFTEVGITRRMYRSGESEYMINRVPCRLKDIRELIMDTGIGVEGYSIIGQGKIADIISNNMSSRREIFEEAAGIVKYRNKKEEAERKLEAASGNLDRVNDIIREIEGRIDGLKEESEKATEYLDIREKYQKVEINIILKNVEAAEQKNKAVQDELDEIQTQITAATEEKEQTESKIKELRQKSSELEEKLEALRGKLSEKSEETHFIETRRQLNEERLVTLGRDKEKLEEELKVLEEKLGRETKLSETTIADGAAVQDEMRVAIDALEEKRKAAESIQTEIEAAETERRKAGDSAVLARAKVEDVKLKQSRLQARAKLLDELEKSYEGYAGGVRFLMNQKLKGIIGIFGELITVPTGWEVAIETVLGAKFQNIVCEDEQTAKRAIQVLKDNKAGRVTFLPVDTLRAQSAPDYSDYEDMEGFLGVASEKVTIKGDYYTVVDYMLSRVIVCKNLDDALEMSNLKEGPFRFVTLDGEIINAAGAITGGSLKNNTGSVLTRKTEQQKLTEDIAACDKEVESLRAKATEADKEQAKLSEGLDDIKSRLAKAREEETAAMGAESNARIKSAASKELVDRVNASLAELNAEKAAKLKALDGIEIQKGEIAAFAESAKLALEDKEKEKSDIEAVIDSTNEERRQINTSCEDLETKKSEKEGNIFDLQLKKQDAGIKLARFEAQTEGLKEKLWDEFEMSFAEAAEKEDPDFVMSRGMRESREYKDRLRALGDVNVGAIEEYKQVSERYQFLTTQRADLNGAIDELKSVISDTDATIIRRFKESFDAVVDNFETVFIELFNGGHARLTMEDPSNPLDSAIEIEAQPPGKKLQNINLLSGGEKTMTAIALMFAVLRAKPTPFCILDEVEAALDEANIDRFAKYLGNFDSTQFALVTHQKATMEYADVLYGVTMPEHGITQVLSLKVGDDFEM